MSDDIVSKLSISHVEPEYKAMLDGEMVAHAKVRNNYICELYVRPAFRRRGIALFLVRAISADRGQKLNRAPRIIKNAAIVSLSEKLGDELLEEAEYAGL